MMRMIFVWLLLIPFTAVADPQIRQWQAETTTPIATVQAALATRLPGQVREAQIDGTVHFDYAGQAAPAPLLTFLGRAFPGLNTDDLAAPNPVMISLALSPQGDGTLMTLMARAAFPKAQTTLPAGAQIILNGQTAACAGQIVLTHPTGTAQATQTYRAYLRDAGFALQNTPPQEVSFFIGYRPGCSALLYLEPDTPTTSLIVLRYLED